MKRLDNESARVKRDFGSEVETYLPDKPTNAHMEMCIC
jgi:hypothetical protein